METDKNILNYRQLSEFREDCWKKGIKITFIPGCWDGPSGPHLGHCICVDHAKGRRPGNVLVVGVANDDTVRWLKGEDRPLCIETVRARMMAIMKPVDRVVVNTETGPAGADGDELLAALRPDVYIVDRDDRSLLRKKRLCKDRGIEFLTHSRYSPWNAEGISTTGIMAELRAA